MIYANLPLGSAHGWGVVGRYVSRELSRLEPLRLITAPFDAIRVGDPLEFHELQALALGEAEAAGFERAEGTRQLDGPLLQAIADQTLVPMQPELRGTISVGYTFFEFNLLKPEWIAQGRRCFQRVATGSSWCTQILREAGLENTVTVLQGVDPTVFYPSPGREGEREFLADKFVVFSGGKFELRKGQDIVIRAFKVLQDRHADVMLVTAWYNAWSSMESMSASPLIRLAPQTGPYTQVMGRILTDNGIDLRGVILALPQPTSAMARLYRNTDVGLFANRCEGGTNLVLMEYMACGKPVVAVNTTGHADIVNSSNALIIGSKGATTINRRGQPAACWPEPDLDDAIAKLEWAYQNRESLHPLAQQAGRDLARYTWRKTAESFQKLVHQTAGQS
jgi:glycosyltransferase involved in cell wall biosynthesis